MMCGPECMLTSFPPDTFILANNYNTAFPKRVPLAWTDRWIYGIWIIGNRYGHKKGFYGAYPVGYLKRIHAIFPNARNVLHLFSGVVEKGLWKKETTFDIDPDLKADVIGDVRKLRDHFKPGTFDLVVADPPYEHSDFEKYGMKPFNKRKVVKDCHSVVKRKGYLVWLDTRMPIYSKREWLLVGTIGIIISTNHRFRLVSIFKKVVKNQRTLGGGLDPSI